MTRSELIAKLADENAALTLADCARVVDAFFETITDQMARGGRVELRGFGAFSLRAFAAGMGRNPATGTVMRLVERRLPYFRPGRMMHDRLNADRLNARV